MAPQKKGMTTNFFSLCLSLLFLVPGSEIRDPEWVKTRIRDKHPGSATLQKGYCFSKVFGSYYHRYPYPVPYLHLRQSSKNNKSQNCINQRFFSFFCLLVDGRFWIRSRICTNNQECGRPKNNPTNPEHW